MLKIIGLALSCIAHPQVFGIGFLFGWLAPGEISPLLTAISTAVAPLIALLASALTKLLKGTWAQLQALYAKVKAKL